MAFVDRGRTGAARVRLCLRSCRRLWYLLLPPLLTFRWGGGCLRDLNVSGRRATRWHLWVAGEPEPRADAQDAEKEGILRRDEGAGRRLWGAGTCARVEDFALAAGDADSHRAGKSRD